MLDEIRVLGKQMQPAETLLVVDAMVGQESVAVAQAFVDVAPVTGIVLTKIDGDARGGAALSISAVTGLPVKFMGTGERTDALEVFHPDRLAGRILGMGDVLSLVERAQENIDQNEAEELARKMQRNAFTLEDFLSQMQQLKKMGPIGGLLEMIPGMGGSAAKEAQRAVDSGEMKRVEAIIQSMTSGRTARSGHPHGQPTAPDRARLGHIPAGRQPPDQAVRRDAQDDEATQRSRRQPQGNVTPGRPPLGTRAFDKPSGSWEHGRTTLGELYSMTVTGDGAGDEQSRVDRQPPAFPQVGDLHPGTSSGTPTLFSQPAPGTAETSAIESKPIAPPPADGKGGSSRLRWIVAGLATILVVATLGGVLFLAAPRAGAASATAHYAPADTGMYAEVRLDLPGDQRDNLAAFMSHFPGFADQAAFQQKLDETLNTLLSNKSNGALDWNNDVKPWFGGQIAVFGDPTPPPATTGGGVSAPPHTDAWSLGEVIVFTVSDKSKLQSVIDFEGRRLAGVI